MNQHSSWYQSFIDAWVKGMLFSSKSFSDSLQVDDSLIYTFDFGLSPELLVHTSNK